MLKSLRISLIEWWIPHCIRLLEILECVSKSINLEKR